MLAAACLDIAYDYGESSKAIIDMLCFTCCQNEKCTVLLRQPLKLFKLFVHPLPKHTYPVVHNIDVYLAPLLYRYRSRESNVGDGKDEKDSRDNVVPAHVTWLDDIAG